MIQKYNRTLPREHRNTPWHQQLPESNLGWVPAVAIALFALLVMLVLA